MSPGTSTLASVAVAFAFTWAPAARAQQCHTACMPDEKPDANGCCVRATNERTDATDAEDPTLGCPAGKTRGANTAGHCCWAGQAWADGRCRGIPKSCPNGYVSYPGREACDLAACDAGKLRANDGETCCWPGQAAVGGKCRGVPSSCPTTEDGHGHVEGEDCIITPIWNVRFVRKPTDPSIERVDAASVTCVPSKDNGECLLRDVPTFRPILLAAHLAGGTTITKELEVKAPGYIVSMKKETPDAVPIVCMIGSILAGGGTGVFIGGIVSASDPTRRDVGSNMMVGGIVATGTGLLTIISGVIVYAAVHRWRLVSDHDNEARLERPGPRFMGFGVAPSTKEQTSVTGAIGTATFAF